MEFKIGDRVKIVNTNTLSSHASVGMLGTVRGFDAAGCVAVEIDERDPWFHNCGGKTKPCHGQWCEPSALILEQSFDRSFKIIIESEGDKTTAKLLRDGKVTSEVFVKRYYADEYNAEKAVEYVTKKLFADDKLVNGKFMFMGLNIDAKYRVELTEHKIYEFKDGFTYTDSGKLYPSEPIREGSHREWFNKCWIKVVE